jgi:hypothetical protein
MRDIRPFRPASPRQFQANFRIADNPGLETVTQQLLNESEGIGMAPVVCMMWISLFAFAPAATPPFWRVIEPTITPVVLVNG